MPAKWFLCPDGDKFEIASCLKSCRMDERCMTLPTLALISQQREWKGKASTTQCLNGTRQEYLKLTEDWTIDPDGRAFMILGTMAHSGLDSAEVGETLSEISFKDKAVSGIADLYDADEECLWDYKTSGSYKVAMAAGIVKEKVVDPSGAVYQRNGKGYVKGDPKMIDKFTLDPAKADVEDWALQLNNYRLYFEEAGFPVKKIKVEAIVRDGGTFVAKGRGVTRNIYIIPIPILPDDEVREYFKAKSEALVKAMAEGKLPKALCTAKETWDDRRCEGYCEISHICKGE